jgi:hypothetical protein
MLSSFHPFSSSADPIYLQYVHVHLLAFTNSFTVARTLHNLSTSLLEGHIRTLVASLPPPQNSTSTAPITLTITFPTTHSRVVITQPPPSRSWWEKLTGPKIVSKNYEVLESVWPFATTPADGGTSGLTREFAMMSEGEWWECWRPAIRNSVLKGMTGWVGIEEWVEAAMGVEVPVKGKGKGRDW